MSTFFRALEQAERDRARGRGEHPPAETESLAPAPERPGERSGPTEGDEYPAAPASAPAAPIDRVPTWVLDVSTHAHDGRRSDGVIDAPWGELDEHLVSLLRPSSTEAEHYRALRHTIHELRKTAGLSVIAISSPSAGDGKTTTAINLAGALAQAPHAQVLLADLDLRGATVADRLGLKELAGPGLVHAILNADVALEDVVTRYEAYNLSVLPAGSSMVAPYELLESPRLGTLLDHARQQYDYVVLDTPPIVGVADGRVIGRWVDGFFLVVAAHATPRRLLEEALNLMEPSKLMGLVFNKVDPPGLSYYR
jgi:capsular exopolysaccharide synthesis family protein